VVGPALRLKRKKKKREKVKKREGKKENAAFPCLSLRHVATALLS
jgi:hypothetical protein